MGRVRQQVIKRTAMKIIERHREELTTDFKKNREFLKDVFAVEGKVMRNRIAGYITCLLKQEGSG